jgi:hypothetical protein
MTTTVQRCTDITPIPTIRRLRRAATERERTRLDVAAEIAEVEWLLPYLTPTEIARAVGRASATALIRWLIRVERWDLAILCGPRPLDARKQVQVMEDLEDARRRVIAANWAAIEWAIAWAAPAAGQLSAAA